MTRKSLYTLNGPVARERIAKLALIIAVPLSLILLMGCHEQQRPPDQQAPPLGQLAETRVFWTEFNKAAVSGHGIEVLNYSAWPANPDDEDILGVFEDIVAAEKVRITRMAGLPLAHVAPAALDYAVAFAAARTELVTALQAWIDLAKHQQKITSGPVLGAGALVNFLHRSGEKEDGVLWRAMMDQARQTPADLYALKEPTVAVEGRLAGARDALARLPAREMAARASLAQQFDEEFPPLASYTRAALPGETPPIQLTERQMINSLVGHTVGEGFKVWAITSTNQVHSLKVVSTWSNRSFIGTSYDVQARISDRAYSSSETLTFNLRLIYRPFYTRPKLMYVQLVD